MYDKEYIKKWCDDNREHLTEYRKKYYQEHKEKIDDYGKKHYSDNKEKIDADHRDYYSKNKEQIKPKLMEWYINNKDAQLAKGVARRQKDRMDAILHYGGNPPKCECCGERIVEFLTIDHINGGGSQHVKSLHGGHLQLWLRLNNYPIGFRVLCYNCNGVLGRYVECPHKCEHPIRRKMPSGLDWRVAKK
jgi:hypothetical protein